MIQDVLRINGKTVDPAIVRRLAEEGAEVMAWLTSLGVEFPPDRLSSPDGRGVPRSHEPVGFGAKIAERLDVALSQRPVDVARKTRVEHLIRDASGAVTGVKVSGEDIACSAVVIATGGFGGEPAWVRRMLPKSRAVGDWVWHVGNATNRGDGLRMAEEAGAAIVGQDSGLLLVSPNFFRDFEVIGPDWALLVNTRGERFGREDGAYWEIAEGLEAQREPRGYFIFDRSLLETAKPHPRVLEALAIGAIKVSWVTKVLSEEAQKGRVLQAPTVRELAAKIGVEPATLERTVQRYTQLAREGQDADFGKAAASLKPIAQPPFYAVEVRPNILTVTGGGMPIDAQARVLTPKGSPIAGLYAAGETLGNMYGRYYVGSGYAIASAITYGRVAGREAAAWARRRRGG
jgi:fumarate reductase flavoprotein subunit